MQNNKVSYFMMGLGVAYLVQSLFNRMSQAPDGSSQVRAHRAATSSIWLLGAGICKTDGWLERHCLCNFVWSRSRRCCFPAIVHLSDHRHRRAENDPEYALIHHFVYGRHDAEREDGENE